MTRKTFRYFAFGLGGTAALAVLAVAGFMIVLMRGPVHVGFLNSYAEHVVQSALAAADEHVTVRIEDSVLAWDAAAGGIDFRAVGAALYGANGEVLVEIPQISIRLSGRALLRGRLAPAALEMTGARLRMYRGAHGGFAFDLGSLRPVAADGGGEVPVNSVLADLVDDAGSSAASRYLETLSISRSRFEYEDPERGRIFTADDVTVSFERTGERVVAEAALTLQMGTLESTVDLTATVADGGGIDVSLAIADLPPALLGQIEPGLAAFGRLHVPISGTINAAIDADSAVQSVAFELQANDGWIAAPELTAEPLPVSFADLRGRVEDEFRLFTLDDFHFDFDGATADISGIVFSDDGTVSTQLDVQGNAWPIEEIVKFVPMGEPKTIPRWIKEHVFAGTVDELDARLSAKVPLAGGPIVLESINGRFSFSDAFGKYLKSMKPIVDFSGTGIMNNRSLTIESSHARFQGTSVTVESGILEIDDLNDPNLAAVVHATMAGPAEEAFALIDEEPLHLLRSMNIEPATASGTATTELALTIPMRGQVGLPFVKYEANATLGDFALADDAFGRPIKNGALRLNINDDRMTTDGTIDYGGLPVAVTWTRLFGDEREFRSRYEFAGTLGARERRILGMKFAPYVTGPIDFDLTFTKPTAGLGVGSADLDLGAAGLRFPSIRFVKEPGVAGSSSFDFVLGTDGIVAVSDASFEAGSLSALGNVSLNARDPLFLPIRVTFDRVTHAATDARGSLDIDRVAAPGGGTTPTVKLFVEGERLDLRGAFSGVLGVKGGGIGVPFRIVAGDPSPIGEVQITDTATLRNVVAVAEHDGAVWRNVRAVGDLGDRALLNINLADRTTHRQLTLVSGDAGSALKGIGWFDTIENGELNVTAILPNPPSTEAVVGQATIEAFDLVGAPLMARLLTMASLKGLTEGPGEDLAFDDLTLDFRLIDDFIEFPNIEANGSVVIVARGSMNRATRTVDMSGEIAPANVINQLTKPIPVIREIFGESVFAASFRARGPARDPEITANPLSILTPGPLRKVLEVLSGGPAELPSDSNGRRGPAEQQATE